MAGMILISKNNNLAVKSVDFDYLVGYIRSAFVGRVDDVGAKVFEPFDEEGMDYISANKLLPDEFKKFASVVAQARVNAQQDASFARFEHLWDELILIISRDARLT